MAIGLRLSTAELCRLAASRPAPRFYVTVREAVLLYKKYKNGTCCIRHEERKKMYSEIFARYENAMEKVSEANRRRLSKVIMGKILEQPAPSFYYNPISAAPLYYRFMSDKRMYDL